MSLEVIEGGKHMCPAFVRQVTEEGDENKGKFIVCARVRKPASKNPNALHMVVRHICDTFAEAELLAGNITQIRESV